MLRSWLEALKFEEYDRHLRHLGFLKGATLCLVVTFFSVCLSETARAHILQTRTGRLSGQILDQLAIVMPAELDKVLAPYLRRFDDASMLAIDAGQGEGAGIPCPIVPTGVTRSWMTSAARVDLLKMRRGARIAARTHYGRGSEPD